MGPFSTYRRPVAPHEPIATFSNRYLCNEGGHNREPLPYDLSQATSKLENVRVRENGQSSLGPAPMTTQTKEPRRYKLNPGFILQEQTVPVCQVRTKYSMDITASGRAARRKNMPSDCVAHDA